MKTPTLIDILRARRTISASRLPRTPLVNYPALDKICGTRVLIKHENLQPTGAFKVRGGVNLISHLSGVERMRGVACASTGNHGQSIAFAARLFGTRAVIFVPDGANQMKIGAIKDLGAEVVHHGADFDEAREYCYQFAESEKLRYIHSANEPHLIAGTATIAMEILEDAPEVDVIVVPVGGGSGAAGACLATKYVDPRVKIIAVQAERAPAAYKSWRSGELVEDKMETAAEGLACRFAFEYTQQILRMYLHDFILVDEDEIGSAIATYVEAAHTLAEGAAASALAGALKLRDYLARRTVALVLSGGNITREQLLLALQ